jgi:hypothetical protein
VAPNRADFHSSARPSHHTPYMAYTLAMAMGKTTLYLPSDLQRTLRETARRTGRRQADIVREALDLFLRQQHRPLPRSIGIGEDTELAARDSEAWLEAEWGRR